MHIYIFNRSIHSYLVVAVLSNISDPWKCLIATFINNFQISHLNSTHSKVRNFKLDLNRNFRIFFTVFVLYGWETKLCSHQEFFTSWELFDNPDHATLVWYVLDSTDICLENRGINISWNWNNNFNVIGDRLLFKLSFCFDDVFDFRFSEVFNH